LTNITKLAGCAPVKAYHVGLEEVFMMQDESQSANAAQHIGRWTLIRDIAVLQVKLVVDGLRDLILVPVSLLAGLVTLIKGDEHTNEFYELLRLGKQSERWINLFGAAERVHGKPHDEESFPHNDIDELVTRVESFVVEEYKSGGVTRQAKERLDQAIDGLHRRVRKRKGSAD
jgi:hypothetical protein